MTNIHEYQLLRDLTFSERGWELDLSKLKTSTLYEIKAYIDGTGMIKVPFGLWKKMASQMGWNISEEELKTFFSKY
ncbi:MAG: hypothetical protein AAGL29_14565 [Bacteroidota bacterium]